MLKYYILAQTSLNSPVSLFVYNRPEHTGKTLEALALNDGAGQTDIIVYSDGWKSGLDKPSVEEVRNLIESPYWKGKFKSVKLVCQESNLGLSESVISGLNKTFAQNSETIILEDDIITSSNFLKYMNAGLSHYRGSSNVATINAWMRDVKKLPPYFLLPGGDCWGWATWKHKWEFFEHSASKLLGEVQADPILKQRLEPSWVEMLEDTVSGKNDSWHIRWLISLIKNDQKGLFPGTSMISNIGMDGSGTHYKVPNSNSEDQAVPSRHNYEMKFPKIDDNVNIIAERKIIDSRRADRKRNRRKFLMNSLKRKIKI